MLPAAESRHADNRMDRGGYRRQLERGAWGTSIRRPHRGDRLFLAAGRGERRMLIAAARVQQSDRGRDDHPSRPPSRCSRARSPKSCRTQAPNQRGRSSVTWTGRSSTGTAWSRSRTAASSWNGTFSASRRRNTGWPATDLDLPTDYMRLDLIRELMATGSADQMAISHDICTRTRLVSYGGHGYGHLIGNIVPHDASPRLEQTRWNRCWRKPRLAFSAI